MSTAGSTEKSSDDTIQLRVSDSQYRDVGKGLARISHSLMAQLDLTAGDIIEISGKTRTAAKVWPGYPEDERKGIIRIDGTIRMNTGVRLDEFVTIKKIKPPTGTKVIVAPTQNIRGELDGKFLLQILTGRPVSVGDSIRIQILGGNQIVFKVARVAPKQLNTVVVTANTNIDLRTAPITAEDVKIAPISYEDIGGLEDIIQKLREMIELPLRYPEIFEKLGVEAPKGLLLHGPPGTGKTMLAKAVANETDAHFIHLSGPEIMSKFYGESEANIRGVFKEAEENAPSIIFIDEIDAIAPKRSEVTGEVERRVVAQLLALMDGLESRGQVVVIAATNRVNSIDPALRRGGRFDREIEIGVPDKKGRLDILHIHTRGMPLADDVDLGRIATITHGFVGADMSALVKEAAMSALRTILPKINWQEETVPPDILQEIIVKQTDFDNALNMVEPSALREVFIEKPDVKWTEIGGLSNAIQELREAIEWPLIYPEVFEEAGVEPPKGILLFGPPGTGKTLLAKAVATESEANFISIKGPEVMSKWVGESEKAIRELFRKARQSAPCIIFMDEVDSITPKRGGTHDSNVTERVVSQLLTEIDGLSKLKNVVVVMATNRPDIIDPAILRPGRTDRFISLDLPNLKARKEILKIHTRKMTLASDVNMDELAKITEGYTGADIAAATKEAGMLAVRKFIGKSTSKEEILEKLKTKGFKVSQKLLLESLEKIHKGSSEDMKKYRTIADKFKDGEIPYI
ncbi:MAG: CDC48 family AAA ATPase [Candidatus Heimdallarchaeota archaeon]|nr:CDC48 family AAA ATPase [Candidatus Heimdallarchaeota archaeon]MBY8993391.1 CDC48 family AAA ATPase [Candidatus Heimdallarchaeota archaeon]